jgi:O-antigen/teichoic acid export membrane protein
MKIIKITSILFFDKVLSILNGFIITFFITKYFNNTLLGYYSLAITIVSFSPIVFDFLNKKILKKYYYENKISLIQPLQYTLFGSLVFFIFVMFYLVNSLIGYDFYFIVILILINNIIINFSYVYENFLEYKFELNNVFLTLIISRFLVLISTLLIFIYLNNLYYVIIFNTFVFVFRVIFLALYINKRFHFIKLRFLEGVKILKTILVEGRYLWLSNLSFIIYSQIDKVMLAYIIGIESVGYYYIAIMFINSIYIIIPIYRQIIFGLQIKQEALGLLGSFTNYGAFINYFYFFIVIMANIFISPLINFLYGESYIISVELFRILSITLVIRAFIVFRSNYYILKNKNFVLLVTSIISMISNIVLNYYFIDLFGISGAASATLISTFLSSVLLDLFFKEGRKLLLLEIKSLNLLNLLRVVFGKKQTTN